MLVKGKKTNLARSVGDRNSTDDDDGNDVVIYSAVTPCYCSMLNAHVRVVSFEACCQWAQLKVQIITNYPTI